MAGGRRHHLAGIRVWLPEGLGTRGDLHILDPEDPASPKPRDKGCLDGRPTAQDSRFLSSLMAASHACVQGPCSRACGGNKVKWPRTEPAPPA